ncbi:MAG: hypothetical protein ACOCP4_01675 [Candidatus Woesearchaeota archaeon]
MNKKRAEMQHPDPNHSKDNLKQIEIPKPKKNNEVFFINEGKYKTQYKNSHVSISNFTMKFLYHLIDDSNDTKRIILLVRKTGERYLLEVASSELRLDKFEVIAKSHQCTFLGNSFNFKQICEFLMDHEENAIKLDVLGYNKDYNIYVFADCIINQQNKIKYVDDLGIIKNSGSIFYLPPYSMTSLKNEHYSKERLYNYRPGNLNFEQWCKLFYQAYGINGGIGIQFIIISLYRDIVFDSLNFFPFLFLFGDWGVGKTSFVNIILNLFGKDTKGTSLTNSTSIALSRIASQKVNSIYYFKEYTKETDNRTLDFILSAYDGAGRNIGLSTTDNKTKSFDIKSALIFDGNELPSKNAAMFSRMILLNFEKKSFSADERLAFNKLSNEKENGFGGVLREIISHRVHFRDNFKNDFEEIFNELKNPDEENKYKEEIENLSERSLKHIALILTPFKTLDKKLNFPFKFKELLTKILENTIEQNQIIDEMRHTTVFWQSIEYYANNSYTKDIYKYLQIKRQNPGTGIIYLKFNPIYPYYMKYCKENNLTPTDRHSLLALLTAKENGSFIPGNQKSRGKNTKAYIKYNFGSCYRFQFKYTQNNEIEINNIIININQ